jgi:hypothetical protein
MQVIPQQAIKAIPVLSSYSKNSDPAAEVGMALFTTALGLYGGVLWSGELQGFIVHEMMPGMGRASTSTSIWHGGGACWGRMGPAWGRYGRGAAWAWGMGHGAMGRCCHGGGGRAAAAEKVAGVPPVAGASRAPQGHHLENLGEVAGLQRASGGTRGGKWAKTYP